MAVRAGFLDSPNLSNVTSYTSWLFYIEGALTMFVAVCAIFILPDFPATSHTWLSQHKTQNPRARKIC